MCRLSRCSAVVANKIDSVYQFINAFPCLHLLAKRSSETVRFQLADASLPPLNELPLPPLNELPLPRNQSAWAKLLQAYLGP